MPLPLFLQRLRQRSAASGADANLPPSSAEIELARVRARRRLVGMVVLVGVGVVALPWLFETQPRPLSPDVQVVSTVAHGGPAAASSSGNKPSIASVTVPVSPVAEEEAVEEPARAPAKEPAKPASKPVARDNTPAAAPQPPKPAMVATPAPVRPPASQTAAGNSKPAPKPPAPADTAASKDAARARALLDGKPPAAAKPAATTAPDNNAKPAAKPASEPVNTRYVVQIGAFSDGPAAREVRLKAERAGVKTYTQEVTVNGGKKIRVRVGPYATKAEADKAVDTLRKAGMSSALLTL